ncbi:hypothetical protein EDB83DRAFT_2375527, partial [Lactarius deliciosus]
MFCALAACLRLLAGCLRLFGCIVAPIQMLICPSYLYPGIKQQAGKLGWANQQVGLCPSSHCARHPTLRGFEIREGI